MSEFYTSVLRHGNNILYRGHREGKRVQAKVPFAPSLFVKSKKSKSEWKSLFNEPLEPVEFSDIREAKDFIKQYDKVQGFDIFGMEKFEYQYLIETFKGEVEYDLASMGIWSIDIETTVGTGFPNIETADQQITLISMQRKGEKKITAFAAQSYTPTGTVDIFGCEVDYRVFKDEYTMLQAFVSFWSNDYPEIITGWNIDTFDVPYTINRIHRILGEAQMKQMSPWGIVREKRIEIRGEEVQCYELVGVTQLDYLPLYKKFSFTPQESYALGHVSSEELGVTKVEYDGSFREFYENNWDLFVEYNLRDTQLVDMMDNKRKFIELVIQMAYMAKCNFQDIFSPVKTWDVFIFSQLHLKNIAIPSSGDKLPGSIEGAWVKDPQSGMFKWIVSFDFAALYPSIIKQWNISPEMMADEKFDITVNDFINQTDEFKLAAEYAKKRNFTLAANGTMYRKDRLGIIPELMTLCLSSRKIAKNEMLRLEQVYQDTHDTSLLGKISSLDAKQLAVKQLANSGYGALCNVGFRYFKLPMGEAITLTGQASDRHLESGFNTFMSAMLNHTKDYIIYGDTDSLYLNVGDLVDKLCANKTEDEVVNFLIKCDTKFQKVINKSVDEVYELCNCYSKSMASKREAIASKGFWVKKKRYALKVHNSEGVSYNPPKIKVMGLDLVKTSTPAAIRKDLKKSLDVIFDATEKEIQLYVDSIYQKFMTLPIEEIAFPRGVSDVDKWVKGEGYISRTPIHVRASIIYNNATKENREKYPPISNGDKLRFIYLKMPNPVKEDVIGWPSNDKFPGLKLENYIDRELQFDKVFMGPMQGMLTAIGWNAVEQSSLESFFG